jgi:hypothetical protein
VKANGVSKNPIFQDGDLLDDGVIHREIPRSIRACRRSTRRPARGGTTNVRPVWLCGQSAMAMAYGQMAKPTQLDNTDYRLQPGRRHRDGLRRRQDVQEDHGRTLKEWGICTGFFAAAADS